MTTRSSACVTVAKGGVGESGASTLLTHQVSGSISKMIVLRNTGSSLCANTGAVAILTVDGMPVASGVISGPAHSLQHEAPHGAHVAAIVHTVPLFNGVMCVRLGELSVSLEECDLVA